VRGEPLNSRSVLHVSVPERPRRIAAVRQPTASGIPELAGPRTPHGRSIRPIDRTGGNIVATSIGPNIAKQKLAANKLVLCLGVNQLRTPNIAMIAAACGFRAI